MDKRLNMKKIKQVLLDSFAGQRPSVIQEIIFKAGFNMHVIPYGVTAVALLAVEDLIYLWLDKDNKILKATTCLREQTN